MNLFDYLKILKFLYQEKKEATTEVKPMGSDDVKPGWKTTEFWITMIPNAIALVQGLQGHIPDKATLIILAVLNAAYTGLRTYLKKS